MPTTSARTVCLLLLIGSWSPPTAHGCGWWGETEDDSAREAVIVDARGETLKENPQDPVTAEALTREGNRLRRFGPSGYAGAARFYRQAAKAGYAPAQNNLGAMYQAGLGVAPDLAEAAGWYRLAAVQGEPNAQHSLGVMLLDGQGVQQNAAEGIRWIEAAAGQNHAAACADLGRFYGNQPQTDINVDKALQWWQRAERLGYPGAAPALAALRSLQHESPGVPGAEH